MKFTREKALKAFEEIAGRPDEDLEVDALSYRSWIQYASAWRIFRAFCEERDVEAMPAAPETLKAFVRHLLDEGLTAATIHAYVSAIATAHRVHGQEIDRRPLRIMMRAARRRSGPQKQASPLMRDELRAILEHFDPENLRDIRDGAMLCVGWAAALRQSELVGLDLDRWGGRNGGGTGFLRIDRRGLTIELNTSKASQMTPQSVFIAYAEMPSMRPWLVRWIGAAGISRGTALFRSVDRFGRIGERLEPEAVCNMIRERMLEHFLRQGLDGHEARIAAQAYSGHSLRAGWCSSAADVGVPEWRIRTRSRHASPITTAKYIRLAEQRRETATHGVGI